MPRTRKEDDRAEAIHAEAIHAEAIRAHAEMMRAKWAAAIADLDSTEAAMFNAVKQVNRHNPGISLLPSDYVRRRRIELANECSWFESSSQAMLTYAQTVETKLKGAAVSLPTFDLQPSFNKLKDWLDSANEDDLPSFRECFVRLELLMEWYGVWARTVNEAPSQQGGGIR